jgi:uncharacterized NAD(P)/FAD-binding protein YdhS
MNARAGEVVARRSPDTLRIAVIGGGFTGAAFIIHAIRASQLAAGNEIAPRLQFDLVERSAEIGRGIAYGTRDPLHRINVPSDRMSLLADDPTHATRWLVAHDMLDPGSTDANGHHYVSRAHYGAYVAATLSDTVATAGDRVRLTHWCASASAIHINGAVHEVVLDTGLSLEADRVALCIGHAAPALPCEVSDATLRDPALITNPWAPGAFERIPQDASVLVVGTGLTMADCAVSLLARDHRGPITAISRRGLLAQSQGVFSSATDFLADVQPPSTIRALLRMLRERIAREMPLRGWQPAVDALRVDLPRVWQTLPTREQRRVVRRLLPFWDVHRFRVAPQVHAVLRDAIEARRIVVETLGIAGIAQTRDGFLVTLRQRSGTLEQRVFDRIVFCTGPARNISANPLVHSLLAAGRARLDGACIGLDVDAQSQLRDRDGNLVAGLFAFGPITRGSFGEMTGAPDIARHIEQLLRCAKTSILGVPV